jgi:hypothetical protein
MELLAPGTPIDPALLDGLGKQLEMAGSDMSRQANDILMQIADREDAYQYCQAILEADCSMFSKLSAMAILHKTFSRSWLSLAPDFRGELRAFLVQYLRALLGEASSTAPLIEQMYRLLIDIAVYDWPHDWESLLEDFIQEARQSRPACLSTLRFLASFAQTMTERSEHPMTSQRLHAMTKALQAEVPRLIEFIQTTLSDDDQDLTRGCLIFLKRLVKSCPISLDFVNEIVGPFLGNERFTVEVVGFLAGVAGFSSLGADMVSGLVKAIVEYLHSVVGDDFHATESLTDEALYQR